MLITILHQYIGAANIKKSAKHGFWCVQFAILCILVELTCFHQNIGATVTVITNSLVEQCNLHYNNDFIQNFKKRKYFECYQH